MEDNKIKVTCSTEYSDYIYSDEENIWTLVSLKAPVVQEEENEKRAPIDMVAVIDKSGSMTGSKINLVKQTLNFLLTQLNDNDRFAIVTYDSNVCLEMPLKNMTAKEKEKARSKIKAIKSGSCTNLCGGLMKGLCQIIDRAENNKNEVASVLLFTDGLANEGIQKWQGIIAAMKNPKKFDGPSFSRSENKAPHKTWLANIFDKSKDTQEATEGGGEVVDKSAKTSVYTFGFGKDHDPMMLKEISNAAYGMYYYIETEDKIAEAFGHCIGGLLSTVAQGIQLEIITENGVHINEVHSARPAEKDKNYAKVNMGDLQAEEGRDVVLEVCLPMLKEPQESQLLFTANLNYFNVVTNTLESSTQQLYAKRPDCKSDRSNQNSNADVTKQKARVKVTKTMKTAYTSADQGNLTDARDLLQKEINNIKLISMNAPVVERDYYAGILSDLDVYDENLKSETIWKNKGSKSNMNMVQMHQDQRSSHMESGSYLTKSKVAKRDIAKKYLS